MDEPVELATGGPGAGAGSKHGLTLPISCIVYSDLNINKDNSGLITGWDFKGSANNPVITLLIGTHFQLWK